MPARTRCQRVLAVWRVRSADPAHAQERRCEPVPRRAGIPHRRGAFVVLHRRELLRAGAGRSAHPV